jgi:hypothetical protein
MRLFHSRVLVALDAGSVAGAVVSSVLGRTRSGDWARVGLPSGSLEPSHADVNLVAPEAVKAALRAVRERLGARARPAIVVLPEGVARVGVADVPKGVSVREFARYRLAPSLSYPAREAIVDAVALGGGRYLFGAVRQGVAQAYEEAVEAVGFQVERVDAAPLVAIAGLRRLVGAREAGVALLLGDVALSIAGFARGRLAAFRTRLRAPGSGEVEWLLEEVARTAGLAGSAAPGRVVVVGSEARRIAVSLAALGCDASAALLGEGQETSEGADLAWLGAALA